MDIIKQWHTERPGNDSILRYNLLLVSDWDDVSFQLKENHNGWNGPLRQTRTVVLYTDAFNDERAGMLGRMHNYIEEYAENVDEEDKIVADVAETIRELGSDWIELSNEFLMFVGTKRENLLNT